MKKTHNTSELLISILIPLAVGSFSALFSQNAAMYSSLSKPGFSPPAIVFPVVWTILYVLMGISSYMIYASDNIYKSGALKTYGLQLVFNFFWGIIFFRFSLYLAAFIWLVMLILLIAKMIKQFYDIKPVAAYLQIPYFIWCLFAAYLNFSIYIMN